MKDRTGQRYVLHRVKVKRLFLGQVVEAERIIALSPGRQSVKAMRRALGLSGRQWVKARKRIQRALRAAQ